MKSQIGQSVGIALLLAGCMIGNLSRAEAAWLHSDPSSPIGIHGAAAGISALVSQHVESGAHPSSQGGNAAYDVPRHDASESGFKSDLSDRPANSSEHEFAVFDSFASHAGPHVSLSSAWNHDAGLHGFAHGLFGSKFTSPFHQGNGSLQHCVHFPHKPPGWPGGGGPPPHHPHDPPPWHHGPPPHHWPPPGGCDPPPHCDPVPEPHSVALLGMGIAFASLGVFRRRKG